jgi:hypothetical protein
MQVLVWNKVMHEVRVQEETVVHDEAMWVQEEQWSMTK